MSLSRLICLGAAILLVATPLRADERLSPLGKEPDWSKLQPYQNTITRDEFEHLLNTVYSPDHGLDAYLTLTDSQLVLYSNTAKKTPVLTLHFAPSESACAPRPYPYQTQSSSTDSSRPLAGIRIALDPGHIGGDWAKLEARYFKIGDDPSVEEATLNMITCTDLGQLLQADGADIVWAKKGYDPTTSERPDTLHRAAIAALSQSPETGRRHRDLSGIETMVDNEAALLFYRVAEIRARADLVNKLHPDVTICVHYNADDWGNPDKPTLVGNSRLVIFVNGAYEKSELTYDDMRYDLLRKLLDRDATQEERGCALVGQQMLDTLKYPPESFSGLSWHRVTSVPSVYARNLLASRLYHGPVIYCEGPYMNARDAYYRIIAGDYLGEKTIQGQSVRSIYREYAESVEKGVLKYFGK